MENRTKFDIVVSMMMAELGDDELMDKLIEEPPKNYEIKNYGYYTDENGIKRWGVIPGTNKELEHFKNNIVTPTYSDIANQVA